MFEFDPPSAAEIRHLRGVWNDLVRKHTPPALQGKLRAAEGETLRPIPPAPKGRQPLPAVSLQEKSSNSKLSPVEIVDVGGPRKRPTPRAPFCSATYASIATTCPDSCVFKRDHNGQNGCFVDSGFTRSLSQQLDHGASKRGADDLAVAKEEAREIDRAFGGKRVPQDGAKGGRDLRIHVGGDCRTSEAAHELGKAARRWRRRGGGSVWTFTHAWRTVPRVAWGKHVSVLASVEHPVDFAAARGQGYAPAIVVPAFPEGGKTWRAGGLKVIPCPAETSDKTCVSCRLCLDRDLVKMGAAIAFAVHGTQAAAAVRAISHAASGSSPSDEGAKPEAGRLQLIRLRAEARRP